MAAWTAFDEGADFSIVVFAVNRGKARSAALRTYREEYGLDFCEFTDISIRRSRVFDPWETDGKVPDGALLDAGWWMGCKFCGDRVYLGDDPREIEEWGRGVRAGDEVWHEDCAPAGRAALEEAKGE